MGACVVGQHLRALAGEDDRCQSKFGHGNGVGIGTVGNNNSAVPKGCADKGAHSACAVEDGLELGQPGQLCLVKHGHAPTGDKNFNVGQPRGNCGVRKGVC